MDLHYRDFNMTIPVYFLHNGEDNMQDNWFRLNQKTKDAIAVEAVGTIFESHKHIANMCQEDRFYVVDADCWIVESFNFDKQIDLKPRSVAVFRAKNPVNGLVYGHQAMIAYNKTLTLNNKGMGLDFTLDDPHESVEILSGIANFNTDPYSTWRTAFREVIKLKSDYSDMAAERLNIWTTVANGEFADSCLQGAKDAVEYYDSVMGDIEELKKSYEWSWLSEFYAKKHK